MVDIWLFYKQYQDMNGRESFIEKKQKNFHLTLGINMNSIFDTIYDLLDLIREILHNMEIYIFLIFHQI